jgi:Ca2+-binding EF-hand superfamily protein
MKKYAKLMLAFAGILAGLLPAYSQDDEDILKLLTYEEEVENPVYMPVLGAGVGYFLFFGNVNDAFRSYTVGKPGIRVNLATFLDRKNHYFRGNLVFMTGELSGTQRSADPTKNLNFKSNIFTFGVNVHYSFKPWIKGKIFEPFISVGVETLQFDSKADLTYRLGSDEPHDYHYWTDGTIRDAPETVSNANIISRDNIYETNLRKESSLGNYGQFNIAIPVDIGFDFNISDRVTLRAATSLHYTFTNKVDDLSLGDPDYKPKKGNNMFTFSYLSLHWDLFSSDKVRTVEAVFAELDYSDFTMEEDEDNDGVLDRADLCPGTPEGIAVDENGCPIDSDGDGVPDYLDLEPNSRPGAIVDEYGVEVTENTIVELLDSDAIRRRDVESHLMMHKLQNRQRRSESIPVPEKFKKEDRNNDGYISFDELLKTINDYCDGNSTCSSDDIAELNDFFFEQ